MEPQDLERLSREELLALIAQKDRDNLIVRGLHPWIASATRSDGTNGKGVESIRYISINPLFC